MGYPDNDLERPTYRSERRGAPPPPSHSPSQEYRSRKGRDDEQSTLDHNLAPAPPTQTELALAHLAHRSCY